MKSIILAGSLLLSLTACGDNEAHQYDTQPANGITLPATTDSMPNNPSPNAPREIPEHESPSTIDDSLLLQ